MSNSAKKLKFEATLTELESVVVQLESGELGLEDALKVFEKGIKLTRAGQQALLHARQKVEVLMAEKDEASVQDS